MPQQLIAALLEKGWTYDSISAKTGISVIKLRSKELKQRDVLKLYEVASNVARIDLDELEED